MKKKHRNILMNSCIQGMNVWGTNAFPVSREQSHPDCPVMTKPEILRPLRFQESALSYSFEFGVESHLHIEDASGRNLLRLVS